MTPGRQQSLFIVLLGALLIVGSLPQLPGMIQQGRDSGIFAYTGQVILDGGLPYVDAWDNKPPGVYYINALAFLLFGSNRWALWIIELIFNAITLMIFWRLLRDILRNERQSLFGAAVFALMMRHPAFIGDGNFTESYALLPQIAGLYVGYHFLNEPRYRYGLALGALGALALLIKPTTIGFALAFVPAIPVAHPHFMQARGRLLAHLMVMVAGGLLTLGIMSGYLMAEGIFDDGFRAVFVSAQKLHTWINGRRVGIWETLISTIWRGEGVYATLLPLLPFVIFGAKRAVRGEERPSHRRDVRVAGRSLCH